ncbi:MAG: (2Fe-2S)-binding protein, partial [Gorillibacterium sp.]|nr:(2Fe-2S)-binding protein [Gorillibacterium sp.]
FKGELRQAVSKQLTADYEFLQQEIDPGVFGRRNNPFQIKMRMIESLHSPQQQVPMKSKCCLFMKTAGGTYCYSCPRLTEQERKEQRENYRQ